MAYRVIITPPAQHRLDMYVGHTLSKLHNRQAAKAILDDAKLTKKRLSDVADALQFCENPILKKNGYRKIKFLKHDFFMVYRIDGNLAIVDGMFHELQDYEGLFAYEMKLK